MAGSVWDGDSSWKLFITSNHINTNRQTWFRAVLAPAILPSCAQGGQKWLILRSKSGHNGRVIQGPWNQRGNSWTSQITSILMGKHDIGPLWPLPPSLPVHGPKPCFPISIDVIWGLERHWPTTTPEHPGRRGDSSSASSYPRKVTSKYHSTAQWWQHYTWMWWTATALSSTIPTLTLWQGNHSRHQPREKSQG